MIADLFGVVGDSITAFATCLGSSITNITNMFYNSTSGEFTMLGTLLCISLGVGLVMWAFRLIKSLIKHRG